MPHRLLRTTVLAAVAAGAVLIPSAAAFADTTPKPAAPSVQRSAAAADRAKASAGTTSEVTGRPAVVPRGGVAAGESPTPVPARTAAGAGTTPRGGVNAGERPAGASGDHTTALAGPAAGALLLAGAGTFVLRRRSAAQNNG
ncbi:hypothetical protein ACFVWY_23675 [Streptomyces sp. NPDC058195]|uniref:hypothetical protein n=1 Tax=Streptomyces sp. NPDC058195 TaxID=3346375 RepID=UPI0036E91E93